MSQLFTLTCVLELRRKKKEPCRGTENDLFILCIVLVVCYIQKLSLYMKLNF